MTNYSPRRKWKVTEVMSNSGSVYIGFLRRESYSWKYELRSVWARDKFQIDFIDLAENLGFEHIGGRAGGGDLAVVEEDQSRGQSGGEIEVVRGHEDGEFLVRGEVLQEFYQFDLVFDVQVSAGFVE